MSWLLNAIYPSKPITPCQAELRTATPEEIKVHTKPRGYKDYIDKIINSICIQVFVTFSTLYSFVSKTQPDLGFAPAQMNVYFSKNPAVIKEILSKHRSDPNPENGVFSHTTITKALTEVFQKIYPKITSHDIILTCDPANTKHFRQFLNNFFTRQSMQKYLQDINFIIADICLQWNRTPQPLILNQETKLLATAVMAQIFLGYAKPHDQISKASTNVILWTADSLTSTISWFYRQGTYLFPQMATISPQAKEQTQKTLREAVEKAIHQANEPDSKPSLVKEMIKEQFTQEQIQSMIITLFVAGQDNVSTSLSHILLKLAQSKELQEKIRQDNTDALESKPIRGVICESLRILCPVEGIGRILARPAMLTLTQSDGDKVISQNIIPEGSLLATMNQLAANDPSIYPHPEKFDIERHLDQTSFLPNLPHMPFGYGTHLCPGWFAYYAIAAYTVSLLVKNFELSTTFKGEPRTKIRFVTQLADTLSITLKPLT
jgi:cytochrome P450